MVKVIFRPLDGTAETIIEAVADQSLMNAAKVAGIAGIEAICGGSMACGTCHVYVLEEWFERLPSASDAEREVVAFGVDPRPTSRLSCQIQIRPELDGLVVAIPAAQI